MYRRFIPRTDDKPMFKPGQLFTVDDHVYRITKNTEQVHICTCCAFDTRPGLLDPCATCIFTNVFPDDCYFKLVK